MSMLPKVYDGNQEVNPESNAAIPLHCGHHEWMTEKQFEAITGQCFLCSKRDCCAKDHRFNGIIPAGMGL